MYNKTIILTSRPAGLPAGIGRSACRHRPVSMLASAGLYAGVGRSLCRRRPVSMPANPFSTVSPCPPGFFFGKNSVPKKGERIYYKKCIFVDVCYVGQC